MNIIFEFEKILHTINQKVFCSEAIEVLLQTKTTDSKMRNESDYSFIIGHVPQIGRGSDQLSVNVSNDAGWVSIFDTHQPLRS